MASATSTRATLKVLMTHTASQRVWWRYVFARPTWVPPTNPVDLHPAHTCTADCSKGCQFLCRWGDAPDCMGNDWNDWGNSETMYWHLPHIDLSEVQCGDMGVFGYSAGEKHAFMFYDMTDPDDPLIWNFGAPGQPYIGRLSIERRFHAGMTLTCLKLMPDDKPTAAQLLQTRTGFFSWVAWYLGEGDWKHYGKRNTKVRPHVPKKIPATWWRLFRKFLSNRKHQQ